jgi:hypothetical protein
MLTEQQLRLLIATVSNQNTTSTGNTRAVTTEKLSSYASGDFWGTSGEYWRGRKPAATSKGAVPLSDVANLFVADDRINTGISRFVSAALGRDFEWDAQDKTKIEQTDNEAGSFVEEVESGLSEWHTDALLHREIKNAARWQYVYGSSSIKVYVPDVYADIARAGSCKTLLEALEYIHVLAIKPDSAGVMLDPHNRELAHWHRYTIIRIDNNAKETVLLTPETSNAAINNPVEMLEVHTPEDVIVYNITGGVAVPDTEPVPNPLFDVTRKRRPKFLMKRVRRDEGSILTPSILDKQDGLNESWTNLKRNDQLAGFQSLITINATEPVDSAGDPIPWTFGPARVINLQGVVTKGDEANPEGIANPSVQVIGPVNPLESSIPTIDKFVEAILDGFDQAWTQTSALRASGVSKVESRKAFDKRVIEEAGVMVEAVRWTLETALALAAWLEGQPGKYKDIAINPKLFLDVERGNLELFKALVPAFEKNLVSLEALVLANPGVEDQAAELQRLSRPPKLTPGSADTAVTTNRMSRQAALENQGYLPADATAIVKAALEEAQMLAGGTAPPGGAGG